MKIEYSRSDQVFLQCKVRACIRYSCSPQCAGEERRTISEEIFEVFELTQNGSHEEIIYEEEPEYELGETAMLKSRLFFKFKKNANSSNFTVLYFPAESFQYFIFPKIIVLVITNR